MQPSYHFLCTSFVSGAVLSFPGIYLSLLRQVLSLFLFAKWSNLLQATCLVSSRRGQPTQLCSHPGPNLNVVHLSAGWGLGSLAALAKNSLPSPQALQEAACSLQFLPLQAGPQAPAFLACGVAGWGATPLALRLSPGATLSVPWTPGQPSLLGWALPCSIVHRPHQTKPSMGTGKRWAVWKAGIFSRRERGRAAVLSQSASLSI